MIIRGLWVITIALSLFAVSCDQEPELEEQQKLGEGDVQGATPSDEDATSEEENTEEETNEEGETPVEEEPAAFGFTEFEAIAQQSCAGCHGAGSGRIYWR